MHSRLNKKEEYKSFVVLSLNSPCGITGSCVSLQRIQPVHDIEQLHRFDTRKAGEMAIDRFQKVKNPLAYDLVVVPLKKTISFELTS